jgi:hypothetical protein
MLLRTWSDGRFKGKTYSDLHREIVKLMPPTQTPNHEVIGAPNAAYDMQRPFSV